MLRTFLLGAATLTTTLAQLLPADPLAKAGYFVSNYSTPDPNNPYQPVSQFVVAINVVHETGDIYWHMSTRSTHSWVGFGIGEEMEGAFMLVSYKTANGTNVVSSPRRGRKAGEPVLIGGTDVGVANGEDSEAGVEIRTIWNDIYGPGSNLAKKGGLMISHAVCYACANRSSIDYGSTAQPFIFAVGPEEDLFSDDLDAPLRRHMYYGRFQMDLTIATTPLHGFPQGADYGRVPAPNVDTILAIQTGEVFDTQGSEPLMTHFDRDPYPVAHAVFMSLALLLIFPLGALMLRWTESVRAHWIMQTIGCLLILIGFATGVAVSLEYNRGRNFTDPHQILGFVVLALTLVQLGLGITHHRLFKTSKASPPKWIRTTHILLGPSVLLLALITAPLGLRLAGDGSQILPYGIAVAIWMVLFGIARAYLHLIRRHKQYRPEFEMSDQERIYGQPPPQYQAGPGGYSDSSPVEKSSGAVTAISPVDSTASASTKGISPRIGVKAQKSWKSSLRSAKSSKNSSPIDPASIQYAHVDIPSPYHENQTQTPTSAATTAAGAWSPDAEGYQNIWELRTPVTVAPPTPGWARSENVGGPRGMVGGRVDELRRTESSASRTSSMGSFGSGEREKFWGREQVHGRDFPR